MPVALKARDLSNKARNQTMPAIEPDTDYQIYTLRLAVPLRLGEAAACDAINETLGPCVGTPENGNQYWLADYEIIPGETVLSDSDPEESLKAAPADSHARNISLSVFPRSPR
jgi:hypothetical protein